MKTIKRKNKLHLILLSLITVSFINLTGCSSDSNPVTSAANFENTYLWDIQLNSSNGFKGYKTFNQNSDKTFGFGITLRKESQQIQYDLSGKISSNGDIENGKIKLNGNLVGTIEGNFNDDWGNGDWSTNTLSGDWNATNPVRVTQYQSYWDISVEGDLSGTTSLYINEDNSFDFNGYIESSFGNGYLRYVGLINSNGVMQNAKIYNESNTLIGTASGSFNASNGIGSGSWTSSYYNGSGTWHAKR